MCPKPLCSSPFGFTDRALLFLKIKSHLAQVVGKIQALQVARRPEGLYWVSGLGPVWLNFSLWMTGVPETCLIPKAVWKWAEFQLWAQGDTPTRAASSSAAGLLPVLGGKNRSPALKYRKGFSTFLQLGGHPARAVPSSLRTLCPRPVKAFSSGSLFSDPWAAGGRGLCATACGLRGDLKVPGCTCFSFKPPPFFCPISRLPPIAGMISLLAKLSACQMPFI